MKSNGSLPSEHLSDNEIIELYWQREEGAISATDRKYGKYLYTVAYNIIANRLDCEECVNDTYLNTWNAIPPKRPTAFALFLSKIIRNLALERFRRDHAAKRIPSEMVVSLEELDECLLCSKSAEEDYIMQEIRNIINDFLASLSDRSLYIFIWRYYYCDPVKHIARMLSMSETTVRRELASIRDELKQRLVKEGYEYEAK